MMTRLDALRACATRSLTVYREVTGGDPTGAPYESIEVCAILGRDPVLRPMTIKSAAKAVLPESQIDLLRWSLRWAACGCPVFDLTEGLAAALALTDCRGLRTSDARWPFPAFLLRFPSNGPLSVNVGDKRDPATHMRCHMRTTYAQRTRECRPDIELLVCAFSGGFLTYSDFHQGVLTATEHIDSVIGARVTVCSTTLEMYREVNHHDDMPVEEWIVDKEQERNEAVNPFVAPFDAVDKRVIDLAFRMVANFCVYLDSAPDDVQRSANPKTPQNDPAYNAFVVGRAVKLPRQLRTAATALADSGGNPNGWRIHARFTVRGHWRNQPCGPARLDRKRIWIQPHWKGPQAAEAFTRLYHAATHTEKV